MRETCEEHRMPGGTRRGAQERKSRVKGGIVLGDCLGLVEHPRRDSTLEKLVELGIGPVLRLYTSKR